MAHMVKSGRKRGAYLKHHHPTKSMTSSTPLLARNQDGLFLNLNPNVGKFWRALDWKIFMFIFYGHLEHFLNIWNI
jgi:hypothetical protein